MKFKIFLEYSGHNYSGWQKQTGQSDVKTVQGTLIKAIQTVFKQTKGENKFIDLQGSGRTDAGVHAIEQVAHLECETMLAPEILKMKLNDELPSDINILEIEKAPKGFHARHDAESRQYLYVISKRRTAFEKRYVWWIKDKLNVNKMKGSAGLFVGMHDFKNFAETDSPSPSGRGSGGWGKAGVTSTKCKVESLEITDSKEKIIIRIRSSHFLWKMVRRIVGTLVEVGRGSIEAQTISELLSVHERPPRHSVTPLPAPRLRQAGLLSKEGTKNQGFDPAQFTAPPSGLFLEKIYY